MARNVRIEYEGAYYHVMARGNRRQAIFADADDRTFLLACLAEVCARTGWLVHAWVLMENHYHLFIETPEANLVEGMKWFQNTVTRRFNVRHGEWGRLFGDRYKAILVEGDQRGYYENLWDYIHLNPCRAGLVDVARGGSILDYPWSSIAGGYALAPNRRPGWLAAGRAFAILGSADTPAGRRELVERLDGRARREGECAGFVPMARGRGRRVSHPRHGWYWGGQEFAERALRLASATLLKPRRSRDYRGSPEVREHSEAEARRLLDAGMRAAGLARGDLERLPANDLRKVALAALVWGRTTVSQGWLARELWMKGASNVSLALHRTDWNKLRKRLPAALRRFLWEMQEYAD